MIYLKYLVVTQCWSLFDPTYKEKSYDIIEANSVDEIIDEEHKQWEGNLDGGRFVVKVYELNEVYDGEEEKKETT